MTRLDTPFYPVVHSVMLRSQYNVGLAARLD
jgi:hypothetical protein